MPPCLVAIASNRWSKEADKFRGAATVSEEIVAIAAASEAGAAVEPKNLLLQVGRQDLTIVDATDRVETGQRKAIRLSVHEVGKDGAHLPRIALVQSAEVPQVVGALGEAEADVLKVSLVELRDSYPAVLALLALQVHQLALWPCTRGPRSARGSNQSVSPTVRRG